MLAYFVLQYCLATAWNHGGANFSAALHDSHNSSLIFAACSSDAPLAFTYVHVSRLAADEGFVYFNFAAKFRAEEIVLQGKTDAVQHEPCRLLGDFHVARNLVTADAILAVGEHPRSSERLVQSERAIFKRRPKLGGEFRFRIRPS